MIHHITRATRHFLFWSLIAFAIALSSVRLFLLGVENYKSDLETKFRELTTIPIEIGRLRANMRGFSPEIVLKDIQVLTVDEHNEPSIKLKEMRLGIDLMQLLLTRQFLPSSWLTLVGVELSIVRKEDGSLSIVGLNTGESEQPFWLLEGGRYEILQSNITWLDLKRQGLPLNFNQVDLLIKNELDAQTHEVHLISQLPKQVGNTLRVSMAIQGNIFETDNINGVVYVEGNDILLPELMTGELPLGLKITAGEGSFKKWSQFKNSQLSTMTGSIQAKNIVLHKEGKTVKTFQINSLATNFNGENLGTAWSVGVSDFVLETEKQLWPKAEFNISANEELTHLAASVTQLDLQELTELVQFFAPLEMKNQTLLSNIGLKGTLKDFSIYANSENNKYAVNGVFENIFSNAHSALPQLENISGSINGSEQAGNIGLNTEHGTVFFPELFRSPFSIHHLNALISWQQTKDKWLIESEHFVLETKDAQAEGRVAVSIPKNDDAIFMDLQASFGNFLDVSSVPEYYPVSIMDGDVVDWLDKAFVSGKIEQGGVLVYGDLNQFPFSDGQGVFEVLFNAAEVELRYAPGWPHLNNLAADVLFLKDSLAVDITNAEVEDVEVKQALVEIPSFEKSNHLFVIGQAEGSIMGGLTFLQQSPIHASVDEVLDAITSEGLTQVDLDLKIPLGNDAPLAVNVDAHFENAALKVKAVDLNVTAFSGDLGFTEKGVFSHHIKAKTLGYPIDINVSSDSFNTSINIKGKTGVSQLQKQFSFLSKEAIGKGRMKGLTGYQVKLDLPEKDNKAAKLEIGSNLTGVTIDLPGSLRKSKEQKKSLNVSLLLNENALLPLSLSYGEDLKAAINVNKQKGSMHSAHIAYGNVPAVNTKEKGIKIQVEQDSFDITEWMEFIAGGNNKETYSESGLNAISIITKQLQWKNNSYGPFEIAMQRFTKEWQGNLSCSVAKGAFVIPVNGTKKDKIKLDMAYFNLSELIQIDVPMDNVTTEDLSLINVFSEQLWWKNANFGRLEIETERLIDGVRFKSINVTSNDHKIALNADWIKKGHSSVTEMSGSLVAEDIGVFLSDSGFSNDLKDSNAKIEYFGTWMGSPYQFSLANMDAEVDIEFKDGRISSIEPGFGRILGLLAMEQWIKRLTLNFGDLYKQGLSYNNITGHFKIRKGKAITKDLVVDAVPAKITISGEADLLAETLDLSVIVVPKSSGAVPIAGTIVSSIAGTITRVFTSDYKDGYFFGSRYKVTGKWDNVEVTALHEQDGVLKKTWSGITDFSWMKSATE